MTDTLTKKLPTTLVRLDGPSARTIRSSDLTNASKGTYLEDRLLENQLLHVTDREIEDSTAPWEMFAAALRTKITGGDKWGGLQLVGIPLAADWDDATLGNWRKWRVYGDTMPAWGPTYRNTALQVTRGYEAFIGNIAIPQPDAASQAKANASQVKFNNALDALQNAMSLVGPHWKVFDERQSSLPPSRRLTFDQWYSQFDGRRIATYQSQFNLCSSRLSALGDIGISGLRLCIDTCH